MNAHTRNTLLWIYGIKVAILVTVLALMLIRHLGAQERRNALGNSNDCCGGGGQQLRDAMHNATTFRSKDGGVSLVPIDPPLHIEGDVFRAVREPFVKFNWYTADSPSSLTIVQHDAIASVHGDGSVEVDWAGVEKCVEPQAAVNQSLVPICRLMLAIRDGTWKPMGGVGK